MTTEKYPVSGPKRLERAQYRRKDGVSLMGELTGRQTANNGDNVAYDDTALMAFTKGLNHDWDTGFVADLDDVQKFNDALTKAGENGAETAPKFAASPSMVSYVQPNPDEASMFRVWESPLSGMAYENEGPDPDSVSMAPAPKFGETELCAEMVEVYAMSVVRDMPFSKIEDPGANLTYWPAGGNGATKFKIGNANAKMSDLIAAINGLNWFKSPSHVTTSLGEGNSITGLETRRQSARGELGANSPAATAKSLFRGSSPGCQDGPYISQFLLQGTSDQTEGEVAFGAQSISQMIDSNEPGVDWMTTWASWISVQNGINVSRLDKPHDRRFITTPRDLATYVHIDQLYQAYFVACLMLLPNVGGDDGFPEPNGCKTRAPFATFGGPHILSLMTEVASRGLRAVRRQKFQVHRRARPERLAAMIALAKGHTDGPAVMGKAEPQIRAILTELGLIGPETPVTKILRWIDELNSDRTDHLAASPYIPAPNGGPIAAGHNYLLPMAFPEGSPMHPAYGAGHATVAGACTTVLKAFFNIYDVAPNPTASDHGKPTLTPRKMADIGFKDVVQGNHTTPNQLLTISNASNLTIEGELNKLAANIAIGRNFAGVHYYTDYYDSARMGERVAIGILREHLIAHPEYVSMHLRSFDGDDIRISTQGDSDTKLEIWDAAGNPVDPAAWWDRDTAEFAKRPLTSADGYAVADAGGDSNWQA